MFKVDDAYNTALYTSLLQIQKIIKTTKKNSEKKRTEK